ncbi:MAG: Eco57I restriction-modification methylase domain-containing protein [Alphaproteobacteria bacterium]|nr:Eco57I restriction-modification methylase domain-containing protein [Alphaproteobacteria bacterium]
MAFFQKTILNKYQAMLPKEQISEAWQKFQAHFFNPEIQEILRCIIEIEYQSEFLRDLFVNVLGYTLKPAKGFNLTREKKNESDSGKADGAIWLNDKVVGVIELKDHKTTDLKSVEKQAFQYKVQNKDAKYVIISNFEKLRLYIDNATEYREWNLFTLTETDFEELYCCLAWTQVQKGVAIQMKKASVSEEKNVTETLYKDYSLFKRELFEDILKNNSAQEGDEKEWQLLLYKKTQKLLDRLLFIFFAEDGGLLPPNSIVQILNQWQQLKVLDAYTPLYNRIKQYFGYLDKGNDSRGIFAYNGGLFRVDEVLDSLIISDELLYKHTRVLSEYDFKSDVDVNILGHIFEHSLSEIEEVTQRIMGVEVDSSKSKRKKDGVFYTPSYITKYIVENTVGKLCAEKKQTLGIKEEEYFSDRKRQKQTKLHLLEQLKAYREWLLQITILDPACGSGAFLNAALSFLMDEHRLIDEMEAKVAGSTIVFQDIENSILENNLFGVDINEESVEIAQLALWLRTAKPQRKLSSLSENIKCGNSLISDPAIAGDKAFDWEKEFPQVFAKGGFDVVIGNPPYGADLSKEQKKYLETRFDTFEYQVNTYVVFYERGLNLLKEYGILGYITPATFTTQYYYKKLRNFIQNYKMLNISRYMYEVFPDANIGDTISLILRNDTNNKESIDLSVYQSVNDRMDIIVEYQMFINNDGTYNFSNTNFQLNKLYINTLPLDEIANVIVGIKAYQKGKGIPKQTDEVVKNKIYTSNYRVDDSFIQCVNGRDFYRYTFLMEPEMYLSYGLWLAEPRNSAPFFDDEKIILRQTADCLIATLDTHKRINLNNVYNVGLLNNNYSLKYILAILNSKLMEYLYRNIVQENGRVFPEVKKAVLGKIPIKNMQFAEQQLFVQSVDDILAINEKLRSKRTRFLRRLSENIEGIKVTSGLSTFDQLEFADFLKELKKQKITLKLSQQDEWEDYFNDYRSVCRQLSEQITEIDKEIDLRVYKLYGLTYDEVLIVDTDFEVSREEYNNRD